jgi:hypothetical protein
VFTDLNTQEILSGCFMTVGCEDSIAEGRRITDREKIGEDI